MMLVVMTKNDSTQIVKECVVYTEMEGELFRNISDGSEDFVIDVDAPEEDVFVEAFVVVVKKAWRVVHR